MKTSNNKFWEIKNFVENQSADIYIYNEISSWDCEEVTSAQSFRRDLEALGNVKNINVMLNSPGGSVGDGLTIASLLQRHSAQVTAYVDGMACSIASVIACAADKLVMGRSSLLMVHNALTFTYGNSKDLRKQADDLDAITASLRQMYIMKSNGKLSEEKITELMDNESWLSAKECVELGLCDEILETNKMVAKLPSKFKGMYNNVPKELLNQIESEVETMPKESKITNENEQEETVVKTPEVEPVKEPEAQEGETPEVEPINEPEVEEGETPEGENVEPEVEPEAQEEPEAEKSVVNELESKVATLTQENSELTAKLNEATEKILALNNRVLELEPIAEAYNNEMKAKQEAENEKLLNEKTEYYKNKFEQVGARAKFESDEVQNLIKNCVKDEKSASMLNLMLVDMISVENKSTVERTETVSTIENLITIDEIEDKYGFK